MCSITSSEAQQKITAQNPNPLHPSMDEMNSPRMGYTSWLSSGMRSKMNIDSAAQMKYVVGEHVMIPAEMADNTSSELICLT